MDNSSYPAGNPADIPKMPVLSRATGEYYYCPACYKMVGYILPVSKKVRKYDPDRCSNCRQKLAWCGGDEEE